MNRRNSYRRRIRKLLTFAALLGIAVQTSGCAVLLTGYLVGDALAKDKAEKQCRANLEITNQERAKRGAELVPDMCAR